MTDREERELIKKARAKYESAHYEELQKRRSEQWRIARFIYQFELLIKRGATNEEILFFLDANSRPELRTGGYSMTQRRKWLDLLTEKYKLN